VSINQSRRVFVVLGLYRPDPELLSRQLESVAAQTHRHIDVVICADGPLAPEIEALVTGFSSFPVHITRFETRVGVHANFARALRVAVAASCSEDDLFAYCDQDDVWHPTKLERQVACFENPRTSLCHCDARIVARKGNLIAPSLFRHEARSRAACFADLLILNSVSGMASVFRRDVARAADPFSLSACRYILHDHWTSLIASLLGDVQFMDQALVDYTQHAVNVLGARGWGGSLPHGLTLSPRRTYLLKCYRQFAARRRVLAELRHRFSTSRSARSKLFGHPVQALFDCNSSLTAGLALSLRYRLRGEHRQADQIWRIWRGRSVFCTSRRRSSG
jgi:glycosyltransferase involved in cell wall biosynthesis